VAFAATGCSGLNAADGVRDNVEHFKAPLCFFFLHVVVIGGVRIAFFFRFLSTAASGGAVKPADWSHWRLFQIVRNFLHLPFAGLENKAPEKTARRYCAKPTRPRWF
jgi:hypothetical protein